MKKDVDLSDGDPVVKDPPLHRFTNWMADFWVPVLFLGGWGIVAITLALPLTGVVDGWGGQNDNAQAMLVLGIIFGIVMLIATLLGLWSIEEDIIEERRNEERKELFNSYIDHSGTPSGIPYSALRHQHYHPPNGWVPWPSLHQGHD